MNPYTFSISLRITHPSFDPELATKQLGLEPSRSWKAGNPRTALNGNPLEGVYPESYWTARLLGEQPVPSEDRDLESGLFDEATRLEAHIPFFERITSEGGRVELFIGIFGSRNFGFYVHRDLIQKISVLFIELAFDVYP